MNDNQEQEINRKRKSTHDITQTPRFRFSHDLEDDADDNNDFLSLSLSLTPTTPTNRVLPQPLQAPPSPPSSLLLDQPPTHHALQLSSSHPIYNPNLPPLGSPTSHGPPPQISPGHTVVVESRPSNGPPPPAQTSVVAQQPRRTRRNPTQHALNGIPQPYPWATTRRATVHTLNYLESQRIVKITGEVQCKRCEEQYEIDFDLRAKFVEIGSYIVQNRATLHDRAPNNWMNPVLPTCKLCGQENSAKPIVAEKKKAINWLFLLLGQMLGCCTLGQLKYFCKHTKNHRTGAKDRVLYLTYIALCKQLDPAGPFDR